MKHIGASFIPGFLKLKYHWDPEKAFMTKYC